MQWSEEEKLQSARKRRHRAMEAQDSGGGGCLIIWLDDVRYFLEDMGLVSYFCLPGVGKSMPDFASALHWLLLVAAAKEAGYFNGWDAVTTGEEDVSALPSSFGNDLRHCRAAQSSPLVGYLQPPGAAVFPSAHAARRYLPALDLLPRLTFHRGGLVAVLTMWDWPPALSDFALNGSSGWSRSCRHQLPGRPCRCCRACRRERPACSCKPVAVSPWAQWGQRAWEAYNAQLPPHWHVLSVDGEPLPVHNVIVVVFREAPQGFQVLTLWRDANGGFFSGWSVPGGAVERGRDPDVWDAALREWDEEMVGHPWGDVVGYDESDPVVETVAGCVVHRRGPWSLFVDRSNDVLVTQHRTGGDVGLVHSQRPTAALFARAGPDFLAATASSAAPLPLRPPREHVTKETLRCDGRKIHTSGWIFVEHAGSIQWQDWDTHGPGNIFPSYRSHTAVLAALRELYGWR